MSEQQTAEIEQALATHATDERVAALIDICVGRILRKDARRGIDWTLQYKPESIDHIVEWLSMACADDAHWLGNTTPDGKPKKLLKFSTVQDVVREADEFFRKRTASAPKADTTDAADEKTVFAIDGGYRIVRLLSTTALDREGSSMGHCVGSGGYDKALKTDSERFFSLRDPKNRPHVTMQVRVATKTVLQARGKQNAYPLPKYAKMVAAFAKQEGFDLSGSRIGLAQLRTLDGDILEPDNLPEDRVVVAAPDGEWSYLDLDQQGIERWPRVVEVFGNVRMSFVNDDGPEQVIVHGRLVIVALDRGARIRSVTAETISVQAAVSRLPADTTVTHSLLAMGSGLKRLPPNLVELTGTLDIRQTGVSSLPEGFSCGELLADNSQISALPERLAVAGTLNIRETNIRTLPESMSCGALVASGSKLERLNPAFSVEGTLDLRDTLIEELPEDLSCRDLLISGSAIKTVGEGTVIGGDLLASGTKLRSLPRGLHVPGRLDLCGTELEELPEELSCHDLLIRGSSIRIVGRGTVIRGDLLAPGSKLRILPRGLHVPGRLDLSDTDIRVLPRGLFCGDLDISRTRIATLPASMTVWGSLVAVDGSLTTLGDREQFETLNVQGCPIGELPKRFVVHRSLDISRLPHPVSLAGISGPFEIRATGTTITSFPDKMELQGGLFLDGATLPSLPDGLVCAELLLDDAKLDELPRRMSVGNWVSAAGSTVRRIHDLSGVVGIVDLNDSLVEELPDDLVVPGSLWIENTAIRHLPTGLRIGEDLRAASSKLETLGSGISIGRSANFTRTAITEDMIWDARLVAKNVFDLKGGWVSGYEPMQVVGGRLTRIMRLFSRGLRVLRRKLPNGKA
ncbi:PcfJ domain-containing protein [Pararhizobium sp. BT-229]|uniref:PcfJ domain-containing protein n=1 Tax=Pararhizobium sp. BT-229 TaxID=2986923 RepID=UPI0021F7F354|nr:PcfJ domain-containing protein [Pararhizobium sp. BT-229]MCV9963629.1 PcfJ domain-containing protein [Pararhizobium sp. BT-229]